MTDAGAKAHVAEHAMALAIGLGHSKWCHYHHNDTLETAAGAQIYAMLTVDPVIIDLFLEMVENNTWDLCACVGPGGSIDIDQIETFIYHSREESVFTVFLHITADAFESALALRLMLGNGVSMETVFNMLNVRGKRIQSEYCAGAEKFLASHLETAIHLLTEYDAMFRSQRPGIHPCLLDLMF